MGSLHLRNQVMVWEKRVAELQASNAQLWKTMSQMQARTVESKTELISCRAKLLATELQVTTLESSLEKEKKVSEERLAGLEMVVNDLVVCAHVELMQEFKDGKSSKYNPYY